MFFKLEEVYLFRLLKLLRIPRLFELLDVEKFKVVINFYYQNKLNEAVASENFQFHYPIMGIIKMVYFYRVIQIIVIIMSTAYFLGIFWRIYVHEIIDWQHWDSIDVFNGQESFYTNFGFVDEDGIHIASSN